MSTGSGYNDNLTDEEFELLASSVTPPTRTTQTGSSPSALPPGTSVFEEFYSQEASRSGSQSGRTEGRTGVSQSGSGNRRGNYPWELWMNGEYHIAYRGPDHEKPVSQFQTMLHRRAQDKDLVVRTERIPGEPDALGFMFGKNVAALATAWEAAAVPDADMDLS